MPQVSICGSATPSSSNAVSKIQCARSKETIAAIKADLVRSYKSAIEFKPEVV